MTRVVFLSQSKLKNEKNENFELFDFFPKLTKNWNFLILWRKSRSLV